MSFSGLTDNGQRHFPGTHCSQFPRSILHNLSVKLLNKVEVFFN